MRRWLVFAVRVVLAVSAVLVLAGCNDESGETLGGNRIFTYQDRFYAVRCEPLRDDVLGGGLANVRFEDTFLDLRSIEGLDPSTAVAARWPECTEANEPAPWILAIAGPESGAVDYAPYRELLKQPE